MIVKINTKYTLSTLLTRYNSRSFIADDPICLPHRFSGKEDREIAGFLAATLAWGQRPVILRNGSRLLQWMDEAPYQFVLHHTPADLRPFRTFVHRTFNGEDAVAFLRCLRHVYTRYGGLETVFRPLPGDLPDSGAHITRAREAFFSIRHPVRSRKHFADPASGSAAKRINMFLRWMVRSDNCGVDFGIWKSPSPAQLFCPLDVHSGRVARELGLLKRRQDDWKAVVELTAQLRKLDPIDPVKYDFALFGFGAEERGRRPVK